MNQATKALTKQQIAAKYNVDVRTLNKMFAKHDELKEFADKRKGSYYFTVNEVALIFVILG
jgi:ribosomal protein L23